MKCLCGTYASFNVQGEKPICCSKCKTDEMIDVRSKKCSCGKQPNFNMSGEKFGVCCNLCKTEGMVNVMAKKCPCGKRSSFNVPGEKKGVCCKKCKTDDMVDVMNKKCKCGNVPVFNVPTRRNGVCCSKCKTEEMIDVVSKRCPCGARPKFNLPEETKPISCLKCKTDDMVNVVHKICLGYNEECPVRTYVSRGHKYCMSCDPNDARRERYKQFEDAFFEYAKDKIVVHQREFRVSFDQNETSKKFARLDGIVFGDGVIICLEVDENGHQEYECDEHRMHLATAELLRLYPEHAVSWVRANPTIGSKNEWDGLSKKKREKRFEEVVVIVKEILKTRDTRVVYIGFD